MHRIRYIRGGHRTRLKTDDSSSASNCTQYPATGVTNGNDVGRPVNVKTMDACTQACEATAKCCIAEFDSHIGRCYLKYAGSLVARGKRLGITALTCGPPGACPAAGPPPGPPRPSPPPPDPPHPAPPPPAPGPPLSCGLSGVWYDKYGKYNVTQSSASEVQIVDAVYSGKPWPVQHASVDGSVITGFLGLTGHVSDNCTQIAWSNRDTWWLTGFGPAPPPPPPQQPNITKVHLVYMTHLDLGFTGTTRDVCEQYFDHFFPAAFSTAAELRQRGGKARYRWTEFPWLVQEYLDGECRLHPRACIKTAASLCLPCRWCELCT